nr:peroxidase 64 [Ipomoea batatas]
MSLLFNVYGRTPHTLAQYLPREFKVAAIAEEDSDRNEILQQLRYNLYRAPQQMTKVVNAKRLDFEFAEAIAKLLGDMLVDEQGYIPQDVLATREESVNTQFPNSNLVDKVVSLADIIDKEHNLWIVYIRKKKENQNKNGDN